MPTGAKSRLLRSCAGCAGGPAGPACQEASLSCSGRLRCNGSSLAAGGLCSVHSACPGNHTKLAAACWPAAAALPVERCASGAADVYGDMPAGPSAPCTVCQVLPLVLQVTSAHTVYARCVHAIAPAQALCSLFRELPVAASRCTMVSAHEQLCPEPCLASLQLAADGSP